MKILLLLFIFCFFIYPLYSETIYIYTFELCNEEPVPAEIQVKEGILEGLFEAGHIVFDDMTDTAKGNLLSNENIDKLLFNVKKGGAYYLVGVQVLSSARADDNKAEYIESTAFYYLYDVYDGKLINEGKTKINNTENNARLSKEILWFKLGKFISEEVSRFYKKTGY